MGSRGRVVWYIFPLFVLAGSIGLALKHYDVPSEEYWKRNDLASLSLFIVAVFGASGSTVEKLHELTIRRRDKLREAAHDPLAGLYRIAFLRLMRSLPSRKGTVSMVDVEQCWRMNVAFFVARRSIWKRYPRLEEVRHFRLGERPECGVAWVPGRGANGRCLTRGRPESIDFVAAWGNGELSEMEWNQIPERDRFGFTYEEYLKVNHIEAVTVLPIKGKSGRVVATICLDCPSSVYRTVDMTELLLLMQVAAKGILAAS